MKQKTKAKEAKRGIGGNKKKKTHGRNKDSHESMVVVAAAVDNLIMYACTRVCMCVYVMHFKNQHPSQYRYQCTVGSRRYLDSHQSWTDQWSTKSLAR
jgi:hypothetical protein